MNRKLRLGILFGGRSAEHEVSLASARNVIAAVDPEKYDVVPIAITKQGRWRVGELPPGASTVPALESIAKHGAEVSPAGNPGGLDNLLPARGSVAAQGSRKLDVIFPVLHGTFGEDGTVQGLLELADVAYVGAGVLGSAVGMDKDVMKRLFRERGLPIVPYLSLRRVDIQVNMRATCQAVEKKFRYPVFVKPANLGSSVGVSKAGTRKELEKALEMARDFDSKILVEKAIVGREIECAVLGNEEPIASLPGEVIPGGEFYDYAAKYLDDSSQVIVPAILTRAQTQRVQQLAVAAFQAVECSGMGRVDFFLEKKTGRIFVNEINTIPGFTAISMYPKMWEASGLPYQQLIDRLIELAIKRHREKTRTRFSLLAGHHGS
jgi:D-alanine-D-alanine ligase